MKNLLVRNTAISAVVVALCLEGCATAATSRDIGRIYAPVGATLTISNMTTLPVSIYLRRAAVDVELGTVQGLSSRTFEVDARVTTTAGELQLEARDRRGGALRSDTFTLGTKRIAAWQFGSQSIRLDAR